MECTPCFLHFPKNITQPTTPLVLSRVRGYYWSDTKPEKIKVVRGAMRATAHTLSILVTMTTGPPHGIAPRTYKFSYSHTWTDEFAVSLTYAHARTHDHSFAGAHWHSIPQTHTHPLTHIRVKVQTLDVFTSILCIYTVFNWHVTTHNTIPYQF